MVLQYWFDLFIFLLWRKRPLQAKVPRAYESCGPAVSLLGLRKLSRHVFR